ncbi:hypothetical protein [Bradyrhizobium erythrophlei]|nr:hypothetical protein [Bradyrhizobium erythrophlei]
MKGVLPRKILSLASLYRNRPAIAFNFGGVAVAILQKCFPFFERTQDLSLKRLPRTSNASKSRERLERSDMGLMDSEKHFGRPQWRSLSRILGFARVLRGRIAAKVKAYLREIGDVIETTLW